jgi:hypothetical protein
MPVGALESFLRAGADILPVGAIDKNITCLRRSLRQCMPSGSPSVLGFDDSVLNEGRDAALGRPKLVRHRHRRRH